MFVLFFLCISAVGALVASFESEENNTVKIQDNTVLKLDFSDLPEIVKESPFDNILSDNDKTASLTEVVLAIRKAKENPQIKGIYLNTSFVAGGLSAINTVRNELLEFKKSGKFIVSYADMYSQTAYVLSSVADSVLLNPEGSINLIGVGLPSLMFHSALEKIGVGMQVFKVGKFKGAVEPYVLDKLSNENRLQLQQLADGLWDSMLSDISQSRKISKENLIAFVNRGGAFDDAEAFIKEKLVDKIAYRSEVEGIVRNMMPNHPEDIKMVSVSDMKALDNDKKDKDKEVYVLYAEGEIMSKTPKDKFSNDKTINESLIEKIKELQDEDDVKAVVLRVNSPGGSAFISEQIWKALTDLKKSKPLVISMGHLAASGGYYISSAGQYIFAEPNTITGSIGIFGMIPQAGELAKKLGISVDEVKTSPYANLDFTSGAISNIINPLNDDSKALIQRKIERGYHTFLSRVALGRNMTTEAVDSIGQGRVWLGSKAVEIGLVDKLGGLDDAIAKAAELAKIKDYEVKYNPTEKSSFTDFLLEKTAEKTNDFKAEVFGSQAVTISNEIRRVYSLCGLQTVMPYKISY